MVMYLYAHNSTVMYSNAHISTDVMMHVYNDMTAHIRTAVWSCNYMHTSSFKASFWGVGWGGVVGVGKLCSTCYSVLQCVAMCCRVLQCVTVCCSVLQYVAVCCRVGWEWGCKPCSICCSVLQCDTVCCSVLQCVAVCCSILQYAAVCCGVR